MRQLRSLIFNAYFYVLTVGMAILWSPALLLHRDLLVRKQRLWVQRVNRGMRRLAGIEVEVRGREHLPAGAAIVAAKHQSAWDTFIWHEVLDDPAVVLKRELLLIPVYGWMARKVGMIAVDRKAGSRALRRMVADARMAVAAGRPIVIFPQGTRTAPGTPAEAVPYQPGVAALYTGLDLPVVPVAVNSGLFWPRRSFLRNPGRIVLEFLPPVDPGMPRRVFMLELQRRIEEATAALEREAAPAARTTVSF